MEEKVDEDNTPRQQEQSDENLREELYTQFGITTKGQIAIRFLIPLLDKTVQTESRYDIDTRSKILAEIALYQAYQREPKFKLFAWATVILLTFDFLHALDATVYGILFIALATLNGFVSSLRSPSMMVAELEALEDKNGMPANYRAKALSSVNTNITLVLFVIAVAVQLLVTSSIIVGEVVSQNVADGVVPPVVSAIVLLAIPVFHNRISAVE